MGVSEGSGRTSNNWTLWAGGRWMVGQKKLGVVVDVWAMGILAGVVKRKRGKKGVKVFEKGDEGTRKDEEKLDKGVI